MSKIKLNFILVFQTNFDLYFVPKMKAEINFDLRFVSKIILVFLFFKTVLLIDFFFFFLAAFRKNDQRLGVVFTLQSQLRRVDRNNRSGTGRSLDNNFRSKYQGSWFQRLEIRRTRQLWWE